MNLNNINHSWGIIGYKFGLYGYLPALVSCGYTNISIESRAKKALCLIDENRDLVKHIKWIKNEEYFNSEFENIVLAIPPFKQSNIIENFKLDKIKGIILEKPLAQSPEKAIKILNYIKDKKINFKLNYSFLNTAWYPTLKKEILSKEPISKILIKWNFKAHHFRYNINTWKRYHSQGGGAIRFYGIHLIAILADLGYRDVKSSFGICCGYDEIYKWSCSLPKQSFMPDIYVSLDSNALESNFSVSKVTNNIETFILKTESPFDMDIQFNKYDKRLSSLKKLILKDYKENNIIFQKETIQLWEKIEDILSLNRN